MLSKIRASIGSNVGGEARGYGRRAGLLSIGVGLTGLVTYLFFALAAHQLSKTDYGEVVILWSAVFICVSVLLRPVEQLLSRTISDNLATGRSTGHALRIAAGIQSSICVAFVGIALLLRGPIESGLLGGNETLYWIGVAAIAAYGASYYARGYLAGSHRLSLYASLIISESVFRTAFALAVALGASGGQTTVALGIVAAPALSLVIVPLAFLRHGGSEEGSPRQASAARGLSLTEGGSFAAAVLLIMLSEQTLLNAGPLIVSGTAGAALAGYVFNVLMIARAPLQLFQAVTTSLLPHLTRLRVEGKTEDFASAVRVTSTFVVLFGLAVAGVMALVGPFLMQLAFSDKFEYARIDLVIVSLGMGLYLAAATLNQAALAQGQVARASSRWIACAALFCAWALLPVMADVQLRVEVGYLVAAALLCAALWLIYRSPRPEKGHEVEPNSPEETELQLAAADEGS